MILSFLGSLRLTLALLLGLSLASVFGTLRPVAQGRYDVFYQSFGFRLLLALLALNLAVCTLKTIRRNLRDMGDALETLRGERIFALPLRRPLPAGASPEGAAEALRRAGYRVSRDGETVVAVRGRAGRWGSTVVHLSFLVVMAGALASETGFVRTLNIYSGDQSEVAFDWEREADLPLGFTFRLDAFEPLYYPIDVQFAALDPSSGATVATYTTREGETVALPVPGLRARVIRFLPFEEQLVLGIYRGGEYLGEYFAVPGRRTSENRVDPGVVLRPVAFRDPVLRQTRSEVSILEGGKVVRRGVIEINRPLVHRGVSIYQTAFDRDKFGFWFAGFQFTRDPGEPVVWGGCIALVAGLLIAFLVPCRTVGVACHGGELLLVALSGFSGESGARGFESLADAVAPS